MTLKHVELIERAKKEIEIADHLIFVTYKMVNEAKFLLAISERIIVAAQKALEALLEYERHYKQLDAFHYSFAVEISLFKEKVETKYNFDPRFFKLLKKLLELQRFDRDSVVRFKRGEKYILTSPEHGMSVLDLENVKKYSNLTRRFVNAVGSVITKGP